MSILKKLFESFETTEDHKSTKRVYHPLSVYTAYDKLNRDATETSWKKADAKGISAGKYGIVMPDKEDPHLMRKQNLLPADSDLDAYYHWMQICKEKASGNPFYQRVYDIKTRTDEQGQFMPFYKLEKLHSFLDISLNQLKAAMVLCFGETVADDIFEATFPGGVQPEHMDRVGDPAVDRLMVAIVKEMKANVEGPIKSYVTKPFAEALSDIKKLVADGFSLDIHPGNFMFRQTSVGFQLVITDPIQ